MEVTDKLPRSNQEDQIHEKQRQIIVFKLCGEEYGLSIHQIKEVVLTPNITRVPQNCFLYQGRSQYSWPCHCHD